MNTSELNPTVGVITRTKNRPILLNRALRSVLDQNYPDWRMVVVNDGGDPGPVDHLVALYSEQAKGRIQVIHNPQSLGMEAASNVGIRALAGQVGCLVIHDDDDSWAPEFLTIATAELDHARAQHPSVRGVITMANAIYERIDGPEAVVERVEEYKPWLNHGLISLSTLIVDNQFAPIQFLYDAEVLGEIGSYREDLPVLGDWEFNIRFLRCYDIMIIPQVLAFYHHRVQDRDSIYGNSIHAGRERHNLYRQILKNEWLRTDLKTGIASLGALSNAYTHIIQRLDETIWRLTKLENRQGSGGQPGMFWLWLRSGRAIHYLRQFIHSLRAHGLRWTLQTVRQWAAARTERK